MSKLCTSCGQVIEDNASICPYCGKAIENEPKEDTNINDIVEIPTANSTSNSNTEESIPLVMVAPTLDDIKPVSNQISEDVAVSTDAPTEVGVQTNAVAEMPAVSENDEVEHENTNTLEQSNTESIQVVDNSSNIEAKPISEIELTQTPNIVEDVTKEKIESSTSEVNITPSPVVVATAPSLGDAKAVLETVEVVVENDSLETISIKANDDTLAEEEEIFEIPVMPEPTICEINPEILGNKYDSEEQLNNEKLETKKRLEEEEREKQIQEELAKQKIPTERPDLLAGFGEIDTSINIKQKKKSGKFIVILIILVILAIIGGAIWFILSGGLDKFFNKKQNVSYIDPVNIYYEGYNAGDSEKMISSFVPCLSESDLVNNVVNNSLNIKNQNPNLKISFSEASLEVVNKDDQRHLDKHLLDNCVTNVPKIEEYKHIFIEQKYKINTDSKEEITNPEFWVGKINEKWYIILIQ